MIEVKPVQRRTPLCAKLTGSPRPGAKLVLREKLHVWASAVAADQEESVRPELPQVFAYKRTLHSWTGKDSGSGLDSGPASRRTLGARVSRSIPGSANRAGEASFPAERRTANSTGTGCNRNAH